MSSLILLFIIKTRFPFLFRQKFILMMRLAQIYGVRERHHRIQFNLPIVLLSFFVELTYIAKWFVLWAKHQNESMRKIEKSKSSISGIISITVRFSLGFSFSLRSSPIPISHYFTWHFELVSCQKQTAQKQQTNRYSHIYLWSIVCGVGAASAANKWHVVEYIRFHSALEIISLDLFRLKLNVGKKNICSCDVINRIATLLLYWIDLDLYIYDMIQIDGKISRTKILQSKHSFQIRYRIFIFALSMSSLGIGCQSKLNECKG